jgi:biotin carboxyl carrier protein
MKSIEVKINENIFQVIIDSDGDKSVEIAGKEYVFETLRDFGNNVFAFRVNNRVIIAELDPVENGVRILHNNFEYEAEIKTSTHALLEKYIKDFGGGEDKSPKLKAPMPGLVVKIECEIGQNIKKGDTLVIIEAMKMENSLASPSSGIIKAIRCTPETPVEKGDILIEIEKEN